MAITAAPGYPQYSGSIINPKFSLELLELFYCTTVYGDITTREYTGELNKCGDQITFFREPEVRVRDYQKNGRMESDTLSFEPVTMVVDRAKYVNIKFDQIDEQQICNFPAIKEAFLRRAAYRMGVTVDQDLLPEMFADADPANQGNSAGVISGAYSLGTTGAPVTIDATNVLSVLTDVHSTLNEQCIPVQDRFIVVPPQFENVILNSELRAAYFSGDSKSTYLNGKIPNRICNFDIYISNFVPYVFDGGVGANAYQIVAGHRSATAFAATLEKSRIAETAESFDRYYQSLMVYGFKVLQPKALASLYARIS
jgi:hypothetical protein